MNTTTASRRRPRPPCATGGQADGPQSHPAAGSQIRTAAAEALGTFVLVLALTSTAVAASLAKSLGGSPYALAAPVAGGLALAALAASLGPISGAHLNPAVTLGLAVNRRFPWTYAPVYVIAQFTGAIVAAAATWGLYGNQARTVAALGATYPAVGAGPARVFAAEAVATFVLVLVITSVTTDARVPRAVAATAIGSALAAAILISAPISGAGVNPARAIGPMILNARFSDWWAYLTAPVIGGALAVTTYQHILTRGSAPKVKESVTEGSEPT